ncbi:serine/threonine-protein kinase [Synechococcus sp. PCC 6312]|uniref:serine/threonine protein kinase n=1 Tax=Synechococcus sp. (strain ATCC 27167 / PCC 6312) TaxID=195253 RepID=UPI00029F478E|nr:serine/threonine-protein kinase [Synechococcus sp. PCC 6312]AFY59727.1 serine/threonine protein kinase [Synechococcus sp. PCC 6312]
MAEVIGGRYEVITELGRKPGKRTYRVKDLQTSDECILKRLSFGEDMAWEDVQLFERETQVLQALYHPAIPKYRDGFEISLSSGQGFALVQDYIPAPSLAQSLTAGRLWTESQLKTLAKQLLDILIYLHSHSPPVIHRDIKPSNILWDELRQQAYLVDFGAVQTVISGATRTVVGTYGYMPPEQFGGRSVPASDLYALGATLIHLASGQNPADIPQENQRLQFSNLVNLSPGFVHWLQQLLEPGLDKRLNSAQAALRKLNNSHDWARTQSQLSQPEHSKVLWLQKTDELEIIIPPARTQGGVGLGGLIFLGAFALAWNSFIFFWTGFSLLAPFPINLAFGLFSIPFWVAGIGMAGLVFFGLFGKVRLKITSETISQTFELFGFRKQVTPSSSRSSITQIEHQVRHYTKDSDGDRVTVQPDLIIWAGTRQYNLGGKGLLSDPEIEWLANALSQYLEIPLKVKAKSEGA